MNNWQARAILFFVVGGGCFLSLQYSTSHFKSDRQIILLNTTRPDFHQFLNIDKQSTSFSRSSLREYFDYFKLVNEAMPDNSDAMLMLGYLNEITGNQASAGVFLNQASRLDPQFFFTTFNLALVDFKQGDYAQSTELLQKALTIPPQDTLSHMMNSIIYRQFFSSMNDSHDIIDDLRQAYNDADILLMESEAKQKGLQGADVGPQVHAHIM